MNGYGSLQPTRQLSLHKRLSLSVGHFGRAALAISVHDLLTGHPIVPLGRRSVSSGVRPSCFAARDAGWLGMCLLFPLQRAQAPSNHHSPSCSRQCPGHGIPRIPGGKNVEKAPASRPRYCPILSSGGFGDSRFSPISAGRKVLAGSLMDRATNTMHHGCPPSLPRMSVWLCGRHTNQPTY